MRWRTAVLVLLVMAFALFIPGQISAACTQTDYSSCPPEKHPDLNFLYRGYSPATNTTCVFTYCFPGTLGLVNIPGETDRLAPQLSTLVLGNSTPQIMALYQVNSYSGVPSNEWGASAVGLGTVAGQSILVPNSGYRLDGNNNQVMILYADKNTVTINYTADGSVVDGYTIHLAGFNVDPKIIDAYQKSVGTGKFAVLPAGYKLGTTVNGQLILAIRDKGSFMDPRSKKDWWIGGSAVLGPNGEIILVAPVLPEYKTPPVAKSGEIKSYPEESEQPCDLVEGAQGNPRSSPAPIYSKTSDLTEAEMREDAGLTFGSPVRGMKCGQVRSNPVMVYERAPYRLEDPPLCTSRLWTGKFDIENIAVPFAESIARHWGGEWDAEYVSDQEFNETHQKAIEGDMDAVVKIWRKVGVLSKLLSQDQQDQLRGQFLEYFKLAKNSSLYQNFLIANIALSSIPVPPKITDSDYSNKKTKWEENMRQIFGATWRRDWSKVPYFPNEQVWGEIKMQVCSDKEYRFSTRYPELMKLGLAANELYKILTPQEMQENYYNASNANKKLKTPLKYLASNDLENNDNIIAVSLEKPMMAATSAPVQKSFIEKIKEFLAEVFGKFNPESQKVFAAPSPCYHHEVSVDSQNNITFCLVSDNGKDGDIQFDVGTTSMGQFAFNYRVHGGRYCWNSGPGGGPLKVSANGATTFRTKLDGCNSEDNQQFCTVTADNSGKVSTTCKLGTPLPPPEPACDATKSCCGKETKTCNVICEICKHTQIAPPSTMELDQGKTAADKIKNKQTVGVGGGSPPLALTWLKPDLEVTPHPRGIAGCRPARYTKQQLLVNDAEACYSGQDSECSNPADVCESYAELGHFCTPLVCEKTNDRAIDIYNNAPFLASVWQQSAGDCYNDCLRDKKTEAQCKSQCENSNYQGFLNYFRPADDAKPKTPQSYIIELPACKGKTLDANTYYKKETCEALKTADCCKNVAKDPFACEWVDRGWCTPEQCGGPPTAKGNQNCGLWTQEFAALGGKIDAKKTFQDSFDFESFYGCSMNEDKVFDDKGFRPSPGAVLVRYTNFQQTSGHLSGDEYQNIYVTMNDTPDPAANPESANRLMFYRIGGVCNANTWLSQKVLLPARE